MLLLYHIFREKAIPIFNFLNVLFKPAKTLFSSLKKQKPQKFATFSWILYSIYSAQKEINGAFHCKGNLYQAVGIWFALTVQPLMEIIP